MAHSIADKSSDRHAHLIAAFAHDVRTPLSGNAQLLELFLENDFGTLSDELRNVVGVMLKSNQNMQGYLHILVDIFRFEAGVEPLTSEPFALNAIVEQCAEKLEADQRERLRVAIDPGVVIHADKLSIEKLLSLLLLYSLKSKSNQDGELVVSALAEGNNVKLTISGATIPIGDMASHEEFKDLCANRSSKKLHAGAAIALYLCALLVEAHGGNMVSQASSDVSTTFSITLPGGA